MTMLKEEFFRFLERAVELAFAEGAIVLRPDGSAESGTEAVAEAILDRLSVVRSVKMKQRTTDN